MGQVDPNFESLLKNINVLCLMLGNLGWQIDPSQNKYIIENNKNNEK